MSNTGLAQGAPLQQLPSQQQQELPGEEHQMGPRPQYVSKYYKPAGKLQGRVALITGGDSGIGRSVACLFALEGAEAVAITYRPGAEEKDKEEVLQEINKITEGRTKSYAHGLDLGFADQCAQLVKSVVERFGRIDVLVNNASEQTVVDSIEKLDPAQVERTFRSNIFSMFFLTREVLPHMRAAAPESATGEEATPAGRACIINTTSVTAYMGKPTLLDYSSTKGAIVSFTRSLSKELAGRGIRVNAVAPGPVWTPLIPASMSPEMIESFGSHTLYKRAAHPVEIAPTYVFLASDDSSFYSGQVLHPNGGTVVNG